MLGSQKLKENKYTKLNYSKHPNTGLIKKVDFLFQGVKESIEWKVYLIKIKTTKKNCSTSS